MKSIPAIVLICVATTNVTPARAEESFAMVDKGTCLFEVKDGKDLLRCVDVPLALFLARLGELQAVRLKIEGECPQQHFSAIFWKDPKQPYEVLAELERNGDVRLDARENDMAVTLTCLQHPDNLWAILLKP